MPRLSVIVPHRRDDQLEATLLSILENRPDDSEIIVVHDGSYGDPYELGDEVVFVDIDPSDVEPELRVIELLNAGLMAACSPIINTILDGVIVSSEWANQALAMIEADPQVGAVSLAIQRSGEDQSFGIASASLGNPRRILCGQMIQRQSSDTCAAPELACGLLRRSILLSLDGLRGASVASAEFDLGLALRQLGSVNLCVLETSVSDSNSHQLPISGLREIAGLAVKHGLLSGGWLAALAEFPKALPAGLPSARAWCQGLAVNDCSSPDPRIDRAREIQAKRSESERFEMFTGSDREFYPRKAA